ncbi:MAG: ABC transporter substrate-binding protein [Zetaproteobacteria bacterium]|nr:ABC transporter substrate-binding protein [Zetaproteobacteria bacterium]
MKSRYWIRCFFLFLFVEYVCLSPMCMMAMGKQINISVLMSTAHERKAFKKITDTFRKETGIRVRVIAKSDAKYKDMLDKWLIEGEGTPDVLYWQAGKRLFHYVKQGKVLSISKMWQEKGLDQSFSLGLKALVSYEGEVYGLPYAYYNWGFYYKKSLFKKYGIAEPRTMTELIRLSEILQSKGVVPFASGIKNHWPATAWFDYINLRTNGLEFATKLADGKIPYTDPLVKNVFEAWKELIDKKLFKRGQDKAGWADFFGDFYRDKVGMQLLGNFALDKFDSKFRDDIGFFPFPEIKKGLPQYELAPTEVFMIAKSTKFPEEAVRFLAFLSEPEQQNQIASGTYVFPANLSSRQVGVHSLATEGEAYLKKAPGFIQYFDRDNEPEFEKLAVPEIARFMLQPNVSKVTDALEAHRLKVYR